MKLGGYLLLIPVSAIFLILGLLCYFNKLEFKTYGLDFEQNTSELEQEGNTQRRTNKIGGIIFILFSIVILFIPIIAG